MSTETNGETFRNDMLEEIKKMREELNELKNMKNDLEEETLKEQVPSKKTPAAKKKSVKKKESPKKTPAAKKKSVKRSGKTIKIQKKK